MNRIGVALASLFVCACPALSVAQPACPFTVDTTDADTVNPTCTWVSGDTWDLHIEVADADLIASIEIIVSRTSGGNRPSIRNLVFDISPTFYSYLTLNVSLSGPSGALDNLESIGDLYMDPAFDPEDIERELILTVLNIHDTFDYIECNSIGDAIIGGDLAGDLYIFDRVNVNTPPTISSLVVVGRGGTEVLLNRS